MSPAGDNRMNSCYRYPGKSRFSINVGNHGYLKSTCVKPMAQLSNYGKCNAIIAPGVRVRSASNNSDTGKCLILCIKSQIFLSGIDCGTGQSYSFEIWQGSGGYNF